MAEVAASESQAGTPGSVTGPPGSGAGTFGTRILTHRVDSIGKVAGLVWTYLNQNGPVTLSKLAREIDVPRDLVMQGVGWLAREGKITFREGPRSKLIALS